MRHLFFIGRGTAPRRIAAIVHISIGAALVAAAPPLLAQKGSPARAKPSAKTSTKPPVKATAKTPAKATAKQATDSVPQLPTADDESYNVSIATPLRTAPDAATIGVLQKTTNVDVIARDRGWTRVRVEGWVPDSILIPADTTYRAGLSAADLRADPDAARGKTVMWNVEFLALEMADPLRHGLADEEPYILARGPGSENALLYLVVPPSLMGTARALQPLAKITVTARVRDGKSEPVGIPILDIQTLRRIR